MRGFCQVLAGGRVVVLGQRGTLSELTAALRWSPSCRMSLQVARPEGESRHCFPWGIGAVPTLNRQGSRVSNGA